MALAILTSGGEDIVIGIGENFGITVIGTTAPGEVVTVIGGRVKLDPSFNIGGDTITLPGLATEYKYEIVGSTLKLTRNVGADGFPTSRDFIDISIPIGPNPIVIAFRGDELNSTDNDVRTLVLQSGDLFLGDQELEPGEEGGILQPGSGRVSLTSEVDVAAGEIIDAPPAFTPGGTGPISTLNDGDEVTGTGDNPTLNFAFVTDAQDMNLSPTLVNIRTLNIGAQFEGDGILDLQNASGLQFINVFGLDGGDRLILNNIPQAPDGMQVSINDSGGEDTDVQILVGENSFIELLSLVLNDVELDDLVIDDANRQANIGVTTLEVLVDGEVQIFTVTVENVEDIYVGGTGDLTLGESLGISTGTTSAFEAFRYAPGLGDVAGSLSLFDASSMTGLFNLTLGDEASGLQLIGSKGDDVVRLTRLPGEGISFAGSGGIDRFTLTTQISFFNPFVEPGDPFDFHVLDLRSGHDADSAFDTFEVDYSGLTGVTETWIRNEGMQSLDPFGIGNEDFDPAAEGALFHLSNLSAVQAANINLQHGTTGNNGVGSNFFLLGLREPSPDDFIRIRWHDQIDDEERSDNADPRFNFLVSAADPENLTFDDLDSESNSAIIDVPDVVTGTIDINGGTVGQFLSLELTDLFAQRQGVYGLDVLGSDSDIGIGHTGRTATHIAQDDLTDFTVRLTSTLFGASDYLGDVVIRLGDATQTIRFGAGNDTVVFDAQDNSTAGLTSQDSGDGGDGDDDTIAFEGNQRLVLDGPEFQNFFGFETILFIGNEVNPPVPAGFDLDGFFNTFGENAYNLRLSDDLIEQNGLDDGAVRRIHIRNDNDIEGDNSIGGNGGATIDATSLSSGLSFAYDGAEGSNATADRFIFSDISLNGSAIVDGGAAALVDPSDGGVGTSNWDIIEVSATTGAVGAQVFFGDLANIINVGELQFTNPSASAVEHLLQLDNATIDALVLSTQAATPGNAEILVVSVYDGPSASTMLTLDLSGYDAGEGEFIRFEGDGDLVVLGLDAGDDAGLDLTGFTGEMVFAAAPPAEAAAEGAGSRSGAGHLPVDVDALLPDWSATDLLGREIFRIVDFG